MADIHWERYPHVAALAPARTWLTIQHQMGLAPTTIAAYGWALEDYLAFCSAEGVDPALARRDHIAHYIHALLERPPAVGRPRARLGLANATIQQRLVAVRLLYDSLVEDGVRERNPVGRGRYTAGKHFGGRREPGLLPHFTTLPWIPTEPQWQAIVDVVRTAPIRNRMMFALAYDAGLRREELCAVRTDDLDPAHRLLRIRAETTKGRRERVVPYSAVTATLLQRYLDHRQTLSRSRGPLFLSESWRNRAAPITLWTWSKVVRQLALRAEVPRFSTHTLRHLCLTDLARAGWDLHALATFAGHRNLATTLQYIHLSGRDLAEQFTRSRAQLHAWRVHVLGETPPASGGADDRA